MAISILEVFIFFILPLFLWRIKIIKPRHRWQWFLIMCLGALTVIFWERWPAGELGLRTDNLSASLLPYAIITVLGLIIIKLLANGMRRENKQASRVIIFGPIAWSALQELAYRGFLMPKLEALFAWAGIVILVNALLFILPHLIYENAKKLAVLTFFAGLAWAGVYYYYPNLYLVTLSHIALNYSAVSLGYFKAKEL